MANIIKDGVHYLSGFDEITVNTWHEDANGVALCIDGVYYGAHEDPDDGYRSYGCFYKIESDFKGTNKFPPQKVIVKNVHDTASEEVNGMILWELDYKGVKITNEDGELILEVGTDYADSYYPRAYCHWHPENLPINKDRR